MKQRKKWVWFEAMGERKNRIFGQAEVPASVFNPLARAGLAVDTGKGWVVDLITLHELREGLSDVPGFSPKRKLKLEAFLGSLQKRGI